MSTRAKVYLLLALVAVLAATIYLSTGQSRGPAVQGVSAAPAAEIKYQPLSVENPSLRLDLLERIRNFEYSGRHRNIFSASLPPPPPPKYDAKHPPPVPPPAPPPPLDVPMKFFGYATDPATGRRRAFFLSANGEDVYIAAEGEVLLGRFRLMRINNATAEVEEIASGRRGTLVIEEPVQPQG